MFSCSAAKRSERRRYLGGGIPSLTRLLGCFFQDSLLQLFLAFDAVALPGHSLQTLRLNFLPPANTLAEAAFPDARQCAVHHHQQLTLIVALAEEKFLVVRTRRPIGDVLRRIFIRGASIRLISHHRPAQFLLPRFQTLLECFQFL